MKIHSRVALVVLALGVSLPLALGQDTTPAPTPAASQSSVGTNGQAMHRSMHRQQMQKQGPWNAGPRGAHWGHRNWRGMHRHGLDQRQFMLARLVSNPSVRERLGITPEQAQKIHTQTSDFRITQIRNRADLQVKRLELADMISSDNPDRAAIDKKLQEISVVRLAGEKSAIDFRLDMRTALTPDQQQKLQQMRQDFIHRDGFGHRGPGGPGGPGGDMPLPDNSGY